KGQENGQIQGNHVKPSSFPRAADGYPSTHEKTTVTVRLPHARSVTVPHSLSPGMKASARMKPAGLVQLRLRLRRVPVRSRRDVLQLGLEKIVQEFLLRVLHLRKELARGRRSDPVDRVRVDRSLPIYRDQD